MYFYYQEGDEIIYTWVRQVDKGNTTFAFVSINKGLTIGNWKNINKDFSKQENEYQKEKFERLILDEVKKLLN